MRKLYEMIIVAAAAAVVTIILSTVIAIYLSRVSALIIPSLGTIHTLGAEAYGGHVKLRDGEQYLDWGTVYTGKSTDNSFFLRSTSIVQVTFNLTTGSWTFYGPDRANITESVTGNLTGPLDQFMNVTWNAEGLAVEPGQVVNVTITISLSSDYSFIKALIINRVEQFSFDASIQPTRRI